MSKASKKASAAKKKIYSTILEALKDGEIYHYFTNEEDGTVDFVMSGKNAMYQVHFRADELQELLICLAVFPINVPQEKIPEMCKCINKINHNNVITYLTVDPEEGQITCRYPCSVDDGAINKTIVAVAMTNAMGFLEMYYDDLIKIIAG